MGLDIAFNRAAAVEAGIQFEMIPNGDAIRIKEVEQELLDNPDSYNTIEYLKWLKRVDRCILVPGTDHYVEEGGVDDIIVRANRWGNTYWPLTEWLAANNIKWTEF